MSPAPTPLRSVEGFNVEDEFKKCPELKNEYLQTLRDWLKKQPHLPESEDISDRYLVLFLRACNFRIERAKVTIDNFYTFRTLVPEMAIGRTTDKKDIQQSFSVMEVVALDKFDRYGNVVVVQRLRDTDTSKYDPNDVLRATSMVIEAFLFENGSVPGGVIICDQTGYGLSHIARVPIGTAKRIFYYLQECVAFNIKKIHIVNPNRYVEKVLMFFKSFINKHMADSIVVHKAGSFQELYKDVPREILPSDYGGPGKSLAELHDESVARLSQFDHVFIKTDKLMVNESKRPGNAKNSEALFGVEGSFKKVQID